MPLLLAALLSSPALADAPPIVGGHPVASGDWTDTAGVADRWDVVCTGVLIAPNLVLTAGHCAGGLRNVVLGTTDYTSSSAEVIAIARTLEYPRSWGHGDLSILVLQRDSVQTPRTLALDCALDELYDGAPVTIVGYGATDKWGNEYGTVLMEADTVVTDHDCSHTGWGCWPSISPGGEIGAGGEGIDTCYGDSGGPMYLHTSRGAYVVGITSRAWDWVSVDCAEGGIYTRPDYFVDWIEAETGVTLSRPDCGPPNAPPEPTAEPIVVEVEQVGTTVVVAHDPDAGDLHTFTVLTPPQLGTVELDPSGKVTYTAGSEPGDDEVEVLVTDDGSPPAATAVTIPVRIEAAPDPDPDTSDDDRDSGFVPARGCSCGMAAPSVGWLALLLPLLGLRRRR